MAKAHLNALSTRHAQIDKQIEEEQARPLPDESVLAQLKRQKLKLKEEMVAAGARA